MKKIYVIGVGGIGVSGIARYYNQNGYKIYGSDKFDSELIHNLRNEGIDIIIGEDESRIDETFEKIIYTEAVPKTQSELKKAIDLGIKIQTYPESLAEIANAKKLITIAGTHGKSTTTSLTSLVLKNSSIGLNALVGSILREFDNKNVYFSNSEYFVLEACEYKRSFINYKPYIGVIINIDLDHLDYYKDLEDYVSAFKEYLDNIVPGGYAIINGNDESSKELKNIRNDIKYVEIFEDRFVINPPLSSGEGLGVRNYFFPEINMKVPGNHILFDAKVAYTIGKILEIEEQSIINSLENYNGIWRRSEIVKTTDNGNIIMSDYGHHPTEISLNLEALKKKYSDKKIVTIFQPHQYNRTLELLDGFINCFENTDTLIIPNIYESRDSEEDKKKIDGKKLVDSINHKDKYFSDGFENAVKMIKDLDEKNPGNIIFILQGAGNIDDLRFEI